jgi:hypothetical protein
MSNAKFGAKEVMDVVLYDMETNKPVIQFDSLKTSSISVTSEKVYARGGKGNPKLITWEINKEATLTIEDALISPKSLELISGIARKVGVQTIRMRQTTEYDENDVNKGSMYPLKADSTGKITLAFEPNTTADKILVYPYDSDCEETALYDMEGAQLSGKELTVAAAKDQRVVVYYDYDSEETAETYVIDAEHFSGTYKLVGDTVLRNQKTGKDEAFQVTIPNLKFTSNLELGFAAEGDPSTTTFECEIMRDSDTGTMIQMVKY